MIPNMPACGLRSPSGLDRYRFGDAARPRLRVGTVGWSIGDLANPMVRRLWDEGRYEIIEGVLTMLPPATFLHGSLWCNLQFCLREHFQREGMKASFSSGVDVAARDTRVLRADGVVVLGAERARLDAQRFEPPRERWQERELTLPPTIVVESVSEECPDHDRVMKFRWYAEFGVPHYWIVDGYARTLECFRLNGGRYDVEAKGVGDAVIELPSLSGLRIALPEVWEG
jgi:hypothetical protein